MTIAELITALQAYPQDTHVLLNGYEGGYSDINDIREKEGIFELTRKQSYWGAYDIVESDDEGMEIDRNNDKFNAILLSRYKPRNANS